VKLMGAFKKRIVTTSKTYSLIRKVGNGLLAQFPCCEIDDLFFEYNVFFISLTS